jgi:hypothetical protein
MNRIALRNIAPARRGESDLTPAWRKRESLSYSGHTYLAELHDRPRRIDAARSGSDNLLRTGAVGRHDDHVTQSKIA